MCRQYSRNKMFDERTLNLHINVNAQIGFMQDLPSPNQHQVYHEVALQLRDIGDDIDTKVCQVSARGQFTRYSMKVLKVAGCAGLITLLAALLLIARTKLKQRPR